MTTFLDVGRKVGLSQLGCHQGGHQGGPQLGETELLLRTLGRLLALGKIQTKLSLHLIPSVRFQLLRAASRHCLITYAKCCFRRKKTRKKKNSIRYKKSVLF